ncbi:MAG: DegV family protein [Candidatus Heimdallarchaeaceae archaeon]
MSNLKIRIITDSAADLPLELYKKYDIEQIRHNVMFEDKVLKVGKDISVEEYYQMLKELDTIPSSSAPDIAEYKEVFTNSFEELGYDHVIYISVSVQLTSTYNSVRIIARKFGNRITLIDSQSASGVQGLLVLNAAKLTEKGESLEKIIEILERMKKHSILTVGFCTLDNVYKSGRLKSKTLLELTRFLKIKPVATMEIPGKLKSRFPGLFFKKSMEKRLIHLILKKAKKEMEYDMIITHLENEKGVEHIIRELKRKLKIKEYYQSLCSPIIGTNTGEGTIILSLVPTINEVRKELEE